MRCWGFSMPLRRRLRRRCWHWTKVTSSGTTRSSSRGRVALLPTLERAEPRADLRRLCAVHASLSGPAAEFCHLSTQMIQPRVVALLSLLLCSRLAANSDNAASPAAPVEVVHAEQHQSGEKSNRTESDNGEHHVNVARTEKSEDAARAAQSGQKDLTKAVEPQTALATPAETSWMGQDCKTGTSRSSSNSRLAIASICSSARSSTMLSIEPTLDSLPRISRIPVRWEKSLTLVSPGISSSV